MKKTILLTGDAINAAPTLLCGAYSRIAKNRQVVNARSIIATRSIYITYKSELAALRAKVWAIGFAAQMGTLFTAGNRHVN